MLPAAYTLTQEPDLAEGLDAIVKGRLFLDDDTLSRVQPFFDSDRTPEGANPMTGEKVLAIWLVHPKDQPDQAVGMATVSRERVLDDADRSHRYALLSLYVAPEHAGRGVGQALLTAALAAYPEAMGFYNRDTVALYERAGVRDVVWMDRDPSLQDTGVATYVAERHRKLHASRWDPAAIQSHNPPHHGRPAFTTPAPAPIAEPSLPRRPRPR